MSLLQKNIPLYLLEEEREGLRAAGRFNASLMDFLRPHVVEGISTDKLDKLALTYTRDHGHIPACLNYKGYPKTICTSVNEVVCHGIPNSTPLKNGDIVNLDITVIKDGYHGDTSRMFYVGEPSIQAKRLCDITYECMWLGISKVKPGNTLGDIGYIIQNHAEKNGFSVVQEFCGHGIGKKFHEDPQVLHYGKKGTGLELQPGMCFTIEPMINAGKARAKIDRKDGWTARTIDGKLSAQFEHTILITESGYEALTDVYHEF